VGFTPRRFSGLGGRHDLSPHNSTTPTSRTGHTVRRQALHFLVLVHRFVRGVYVFLLLFVLEEEEE
jgi:hypothetical protein